MPARKKKAPELCGGCFPYGLADQPNDATQVSCEHGAWNVADVAAPAPAKAAAGDEQDDGE